MPVERVGRLPFAAAACFALSAVMLTSFPIIAPQVASDLGSSYAAAGAIAAAYMFGYGVFQIPDDGGLLVKAADQMEQQLAAGLSERQVAEFIEHDEVLPTEIFGHASLATGSASGLELVD